MKCAKDKQKPSKRKTASDDNGSPDASSIVISDDEFSPDVKGKKKSGNSADSSMVKVLAAYTKVCPTRSIISWTLTAADLSENPGGGTLVSG